MAVVHRAHDSLLGEDVALKVFSLRDDAVFERMVREVRLARRVTHANVGRTFDVGVDGDIGFVTMELVDGEPVSDRIRRHGALAAPEAARVVLGVAGGLAAAHAAGVVHRDLKPSNVLIAGDGRVVIIDFGVSEAIADGAQERQSGLTFDYAAPEQLDRRRAPSPSMDSYSLGLLTFELFTGRRLVEGDDPMDRLRRRLSGEWSLDGLGSWPAVASLVASCLRIDPELRPPASDVAQALSSLTRSELAVSLPTLSTGETGRSPEGRAVIAVAPFSVSGRDEHFGVGRAVASELCDVLAATEGIVVVRPREAEAEHGNEWARTSGAGYLVEGRLLRTGGVVRLETRLVAIHDALVKWSGAIDGSEDELLRLGADTVARIVESLRLAVDLEWVSKHASSAVMLRLLEGRELMRSPAAPPSDAVALFDACIVEAPECALARSLRALASARAFVLEDSALELEQRSERFVEEARAMAPHFPDTDVALGVLRLGQGRVHESVVCFERALARAPSHPYASEMLGRIECESGRASRGAERLLRAFERDPARHTAAGPAARAHALRGRIEAFDHLMARAAGARGRASTLEELALQARVALWTWDADRASRVHAALPAHPPFRPSSFALVAAIADVARGVDATPAVRAHVTRALAGPVSPRLATTLLQVGAEALATHDPVAAMEWVDDASQRALFDIEWLELCPSLDVLRDSRRFAAARDRVRERVHAIWSAES